MSSKQLILAFVLTICLIESLTDEKEKYAICGEDPAPIESAYRLYETNLVYLISEDKVYELQIKKANQSRIEEVRTLHDWSEEIEPPIDIIMEHTHDHKLISLVNCESGTQWFVNYEKGQYNHSDKWECGRTFEFLMGRTDDQIIGTEAHKYSLEYYSDTKDIKNRMNYYFIRSNDSSDNPIKYIKWVNDAFDTTELDATHPFSTLNGQRIKAAFIYDFHWFIFGGKYYCRVKLNENTFEECRPLLISDWITDCHKEEQEEGDGEQKVQETKKSAFSFKIIFLLIVIVVAIAIVLFIFSLIYKEVSKKTTTATTPQKKTSASSKS